VLNIEMVPAQEVWVRMAEPSWMLILRARPAGSSPITMMLTPPSRASCHITHEWSARIDLSVALMCVR
jgi:hypothetical protein